jgi:hypothetical protein
MDEGYRRYDCMPTIKILISHTIDPVSRNAKHIESIPAATPTEVLSLMKKIFLNL